MQLPVSSYTTSIAVSRNGKLFAVIPTSGSSPLWTSADHGATWSIVAAPAAVASGAGFSLVSDPVSPAVLYALTGQGLFRTSDGGSSWFQLGSGVPSCLAIDPNDPSTLFTGATPIQIVQGDGGVWKSKDAGAHWQALTLPFPSDDGVVSLAVGPSSSIVLVGSQGDGIAESEDAGQTWTSVRSGLPGPTVTTLAVDSESPAVVYAGIASVDTCLDLWDRGPVYNYSRLDRSADAGRNWTADLDDLSTANFASIAVDPASPNVVFAATQSCDRSLRCIGGVWKTADRGNNWSRLPLGPTSAIAIDPASPQTVYVSGAKSVDGGVTWTDLTNFPDVDQLLVEPTTSAVYGASCFSGVSVSTDGGVTWSARNMGLSDPCVFSLARDSQATMYAATRAGIFRSTDRAMSWTAIGSWFSATAVVVDPNDAKVLFAGTSGGVYRSLDGGMSWTTFNDGLGNLNVTALAVDAAGEFLHAATPSGVYDLRLSRTRFIRPR